MIVDGCAAIWHEDGSQADRHRRGLNHFDKGTAVVQHDEADQSWRNRQRRDYDRGSVRDADLRSSTIDGVVVGDRLERIAAAQYDRGQNLVEARLNAVQGSKWQQSQRDRGYEDNRGSSGVQCR